MFKFGWKASVPDVVARILLISGVVCLEHQPTQKQPTSAHEPSPSVPPQILLIHHVESRTSSITIRWTSNFSYSSYQVRARSLLSGITLIGQPTNTTEFTMTDLMIDNPYDICVTADVTGAQVTRSRAEAGREKRSIEACLELRTIPLIRVDSVLVFLGVIAFVVLSIAAALVCWKCAQKDDATTSMGVTTSDCRDSANGMESDVRETVIRNNPDEAARPLLGDEKTDKVNSQPELEFASGGQPANNLQSNELSGQPTSDRPPLV